MDPTKLIRIHRVAQEMVHQAMTLDRIINVPIIAERVRLECEDLNVALEDIEGVILNIAERGFYPMEFDGQAEESQVRDRNGEVAHQ